MTSPDAAPTKRLLSLDALRGFNMFWIIGGDDLVHEFLRRFHNPVVAAVSENLTRHTQWEGFHFYDMIFPLFLFIIGVTLPFTTAKRLDMGQTRRQMIGKILRRAATLFFLGWVTYGFFEFKGFDQLRILGVLQRLAIGYCFAAIVLLFTRPRHQFAIAVALLLVYWGVMTLIPVPGVPRGSMTKSGNLAYYVDRCVFKPGQRHDDFGDPEGLLSTIPALSTALLGVLTGHWLRSPREQRRKVLGLVVTGVALIILGNLWGHWFPVIKKIWTSSYVLVAGGWSMLLLALFYWLIDVRGYRRWTYVFVIIGVNPLTIYVLGEVFDFGKVAGFFVDGALRFVPAWEPCLSALSVLVVEWLLLWFLHSRKIYLRA